VVGRRRKHSEERLDERLEEEEAKDEERGIFELFGRDEDAPLARDGDADEDE
jgi:hypothetical protein